MIPGPRTTLLGPYKPRGRAARAGDPEFDGYGRPRHETLAAAAVLEAAE